MTTADIQYENTVNANGFITGGLVEGVGIGIQWQDGPLKDGEEPNGAFLEGVIYAALQRLQAYQDSPLSCRENALAVTKLEEAMHWLAARRSDREARGVQGGYLP